MTSKGKPDYAEFMRKGPSLGLSPESDREANHPVLETDIPWGEVVLDPEEESLEDFQPGPFGYSLVNQPPLLPILIIGLLVVALLFW
jgi:hypothetical protein